MEWQLAITIVGAVTVGVFFGSCAHSAALIRWTRWKEQRRQARMLKQLCEEQKFFSGDEVVKRTADAVLAGFKAAGKTRYN